MILLVSGAVVFVVTAVVFWMCLPRNGVTHRLVGTAWESYVAVGFCSALALSWTLMLSGVLELVGKQ